MWKCRAWLLDRGHYKRKIPRTQFRLLSRQNQKRLPLVHPCGESLASAAGGELRQKLRHISRKIRRSENRALRLTNKDNSPSHPSTTRCRHHGYLHLLLGAALLVQLHLPLKVEPGHPLILDVARLLQQRSQLTLRSRSQVLVNPWVAVEHVLCQGIQTRLTARRHRNPRQS
jgi:hypothetical protein